MNHRSLYRCLRQLCLCLSVIATLQPNVARAEDAQADAERREGDRNVPELFITANRVAVPLENIGRAVDSRTKEEIAELQTHSLTESLQMVSGVRLSDLGGPGAPGVTPIDIRGFRTGGTQILLNGMSLSDPTSISGTFEAFFSYLTTDDLAAVEVLKGSTGVLYGSDGQAGAINLITASPEPGIRGTASFEGGSYETFTETAFVNAGVERGGVVGSVTRIDSSGLDTHGNYGNTTAMLSGRYELVAGELTIEPLIRVVDAQNDIDTNPTVNEAGELVPNQDTERNNVDAQAIFAALTARFEPVRWYEMKTSIYTNRIERDYFFDFGGFGSTSDLDGDTLTVDQQNTFRLTDLATDVILGVEYERLESETDNDGTVDEEGRDQYAAFVHTQTSLLNDRLNLAGGARVTEIGDLDRTVSTLEASGVFKLPEVNSRLHTSVAQGFRAPTLFESDGTLLDFDTGELVDVGNRDLEEEEALSFDVGYEQRLFDGQFVADVTFFQIDADQTIIFDFANRTHINGGGGKTQGIETSLAYKPWSWARFDAAYTYLDKAQGRDGLRRQRTPRNWFALGATFTPSDIVTISTELRHRDSQELEFFGLAERYEEGEATVFDAAVTYHALKEIDLFVRADNIFDEEYTEHGFRMPGASLFGGFKLKLG